MISISAGLKSIRSLGCSITKGVQTNRTGDDLIRRKSGLDPKRKICFLFFFKSGLDSMDLSTILQQMNIDQSMKVSLKCKKISFSLRCNKAQLAFAEESLSGLNNHTNLDFKSNQFFIFLPTNIYNYINGDKKQFCNIFKIYAMKFDSCGNKTGPLHWTEGHKIPFTFCILLFTFCILHFAFYILQPSHNIPTLASLIELSSLEEQHNLWLFILIKTIKVDRWQQC